jgi:hypothetical protein
MIVETSLLLLSLLQSYHQHCHYCRNIAQASLSQSHWQGTALRKMFPPFTSYFRWLSDQGQSSRTKVMQRPTKPQSQSCTGFTKSYIKPKPTPKLPWLQKSCSHFSLCLVGSEEDVPSFTILLLMTQWSGQGFTYPGNVASDQATKSNLCWYHVFSYHLHQHRHDCRNLTLTSLSITKLSSTLPLL